MLRQASYIHSTDPSYIENLYQQWKVNPDSLDPDWQRFFEGFDLGKTILGSVASSSNGVVARSRIVSSGIEDTDSAKELAIMNLIFAYRSRGHLVADIIPFRKRGDHKPKLSIEDFGLNEDDLDMVFKAGHALGIGDASLRDIITHLQDTYTSAIGVEYLQIRKPEVLEWLQSRMEKERNRRQYEVSKKRQILQKLNEAEVFETFLQTKYVGQKRFSLEGGESLIPALDSLIQKGASLGSQEFVIGMAHRGRLNVLANILKKTYESIFAEFEGFSEPESVAGSGDVKYHKGYSFITRSDEGKQIKLSLTFNPSHLEAINPVVEGITRAKTEQFYNGDSNQIIPVLIHGDAAVAGQGVVYETLQLSETPGYSAGGTIHIVLNNFIGFTTNPREARSSLYCTDVAKTIRAPIFHVNGNDPEAVVYCMELAVEFRQLFKRDVFIDICCYRKYGHNESDEPRFTQPVMYKQLETQKNAREAYTEQLLHQGVIEARMAQEMVSQFKENLDERLRFAKESKKGYQISAFESNWSKLRASKKEDFLSSPDTSVSMDVINQICDTLSSHPKSFKPIPKVSKVLKNRKNMQQAGAYNWEMGELFAYGSLLLEGFPVRLSGQDVQRGTFSHRHAVLRDANTEDPYIGLQHLAKNQAPIYIYNSPLSEFGVLGFEYGYSLASPSRLVVWEAQFGDFVNGAQVILDQFISSSEEKWSRRSGLILLLPHGYEGQGPEHSSARIERFLQLAAQRNFQVVNCTTPANFFHVLRRQLHRPFRLPLVVFTPKSLLRHPECMSPVSEFTSGGFKEVIDDHEADPKKVKRLIFSFGKIYYDLLEYKRKHERQDVALIRIEQLYPLPRTQIKEINLKYNQCERWIWAQEEPANMGGWNYMVQKYRGSKLELVSRKRSASPAEGSAKLHKEIQDDIIKRAFEKNDDVQDVIDE